jgi:hypothetical protein
MVIETIELDNNKEKVIIRTNTLSYDEVLELAEEILKARDEKEMDKGLDIDRYDDVKQINLARKGGMFNITPYELEQMSAELSEINNIIALAKADDDVKKVLLIEIVSEFKEDLEQFFDDYPRYITDEKLENIVTIVEENLDYERQCSNENCETYAYINDKDKERIKKYIKQEIIK